MGCGKDRMREEERDKLVDGSMWTLNTKKTLEPAPWNSEKEGGVVQHTQDNRTRSGLADDSVPKPLHDGSRTVGISTLSGEGRPTSKAQPLLLLLWHCLKPAIPRED